MNKPSSFARQLPSALLLGFVSLCVFPTVVYALPDHAYSGNEYAAMRRQTGCDTTLTYAKILSDPTLYTGKILEVSGKIAGRSSDGVNLSVVLALSDGNTVSLDLPVSAADALNDDPTARVRFLAQVGTTAVSNIPPLKALGFVHESEIRKLELAEEAKTRAAKELEERKRQKAERWKKEAERAMAVNAAASSAASANMAPPPVNADIASLQNYLGPRARGIFWPYYKYIAKTNERLDATMVGKITFHLLNFADHNNVDPRLVVAMIFAESHFDPNATSHAGAMGLGQLMPGTARSLGVDNPYDPIQNLGGSINYLRSRLDTFSDHALPGGAVSFEQAALAMAAYNAGVNAVKRYNGIPPYTQTQNYVRKVISLYKILCS